MRIFERHVLLAAVILSLIAMVPVNAAFGDLDSTFGRDGQIAFHNNGAIARALVRQKDGKFIAVGSYNDGSAVNNFVMLVRRFDADGNLDTSFGSGGSAVTYNTYGIPKCVALQSDGKILVGGKGGIDSVTNTTAYVWRFNTDGWYDTSFGTNGRVLAGSAAEGVETVTAFKTSTISSTESILLAYGQTIKRLNSNGTVNTSFGTSGSITGLGGVFVKQNASPSQPPNIVTAHFFNSYTILRGFTADGDVNPDFGSNGLTISYYGDYDVPVLRGLIRTNQDRIIVWGRYCFPSGPPSCVSSQSFIASHSADGVLENTEAVGFLGEAVRANPDGTLIAFPGNQFMKLSSSLSVIQQSPANFCWDHFIQPDTKVVCTAFLNIQRRLQ